ncbi:MAG TPA: LytTR family transcriptional regulator DNA-binding domain-containing protein [Gemmatimonas sp.]|nr:LytTR family transcriptional regulator DNA-binding domain-containing protein [Gemmatimonas sp.]
MTSRVRARATDAPSATGAGGIDVQTSRPTVVCAIGTEADIVPAIQRSSAPPLQMVLGDHDDVSRRCFTRAGVRMLRVCPDEASTLNAAIRLAPDIVVVNAQLSGKDGLDVMKRIVDIVDPAARPLLVVLGRVADDAVRAYELGVDGYLALPLTPARILDTLNRMRRVLADRQLVDFAKDVIARAPNAGAAPQYALASSRPLSPLTRLLVQHADKAIVVRTANIDWIEAAGIQSRVYVGSTAYVMRASLSALVQRLDQTSFARIHRSVIVNLDKVVELHDADDSDTVVVMESGTRLRVSRRRRAELTRRYWEVA